MRLAELDVDAKGEGPELVSKSASRMFRSFLPASICRGHHNKFLLPLGIEQLPDPLQHFIGERYWERQFQGVAAEIVIPLCFLVRVQATNEDVVYGILETNNHSGACYAVRTVISGNRPCSKLLVGILGVEVGLLPNAKEDFLSKHVGCRESLACFEDGDGGSGFDPGHGEGRLQTVLVHIIGADDVVVSLVKLLLVRPCHVSAIPSTESEEVHPRSLFGDPKAPE